MLLIAIASMACPSLALRPHRPAALSRRSAVLASALALAARPRSSRAGDFFGYESGRAMQLQNQELETSPLIEELKRRTEANKEKNAAKVKETITFTNAVNDDTAGTRMVRYQGTNDVVPVTRLMSPEQVKELEALGYSLKCPTWGGTCELRTGSGGTAR